MCRSGFDLFPTKHFLTFTSLCDDMTKGGERLFTTVGTLIMIERQKASIAIAMVKGFYNLLKRRNACDAAVANQVRYRDPTCQPYDCGRIHSPSRGLW
jgi:hypothetical protein